jgi:hypothetical protein
LIRLIFSVALKTAATGNSQLLQYLFREKIRIK